MLCSRRDITVSPSEGCQPAILKIHADIEFLRTPLFVLADRVLAALPGPPSCVVSEDASGRFISRFMRGVLARATLVPLKAVKVHPIIKFGDSRLLFDLVHELNAKGCGARPLIVTDSIVSGRGLARVVEILHHLKATPLVATLNIYEPNLALIRRRILAAPGDLVPNRFLHRRNNAQRATADLVFGRTFSDSLNDEVLAKVWGRPDLNGIQCLYPLKTSGDPFLVTEDLCGSWHGDAGSVAEREVRATIGTYVDKMLDVLVEQYGRTSANAGRPEELSLPPLPKLL